MTIPKDGYGAWQGVIHGIAWASNKIIRLDSWIILVILGVSVFSGTLISRIRYYDDITTFFPEGNKAVNLFVDVGKQFGGLDIALVGVETDDIFEAKNLMLVRKLSRRFTQVEGVDAVISITEMQDFEERVMGAESGSYVQDLIGDLAADMGEDEIEAIRERVMSREHIVGSMVSQDGRAALIVCRLTPGSNIKDVADSIRTAGSESSKGMRGVRLFYGGAPLVSSYIAALSQKDMLWLTPFVVLAVIIVIFSTLRSLPASLLSLLTIALSVLWTLGLMVLLDKPLTLVSSSLPMLLVALGTAYGIHILVRYFKLLEDSPAGTDRKVLVTETLRQIAIPVIMAGVTTIVGFSSFLVMDTQPLREFGIMMAMGVLISLFMSLVFIPAMLSRFDLGRLRMGRQSDRIPSILDAVASKACKHHVIVLVLFSIVMAGAIFGMTRITTHSSLRSYFTHDSEPIHADDFLIEKFGGSIFIQLYVKGDMRNPLVLKELEKLEYMIAGMRDVSNMQSATTVITMANSAMMGKRQIPDTREQTETLAFLAEDDPSVWLLVDKEWSGALTQIRIGGFDLERANGIAKEIERTLDKEIFLGIAEVDLASVRDDEVRGRLLLDARKDAARRLDVFLTSRRVPHVDARAIEAIVAEEWKRTSYVESDEFRSGVEDVLTLNVVEDDLVYLRDEEADWDAIVDGVIAGFADGKISEKEAYGLLYSYASDEEHALEEKAQLGRKEKGGSDPTGFQKAASSIRQGLEDVQRGMVARNVLSKVVKGKLPDRTTASFRLLRDRTDEYLAFLYSGRVLVSDGAVPPGVAPSATGHFEVSVTGYPLLYQQMNVSVVQNQIKSSVVALAILFVLLAGLFRSIRIGVVALVPCVTTLVVTFGGLGVLGMPMDIGVSMITIIAMGAAVDYPIHFIWKYWEVAHKGFAGGLKETMFTTGRAVFANTFEVMFGFSILLAASLIPIRKVGGMIAVTLLLAGIATLFLMPVFLRFAHEKVYRPLERDISAAAKGPDAPGQSRPST